MSRARSMTPLQLTDAIARERDGRPDIAAMTGEERREAGLMDLGQAAGHEHLASAPQPRLADRSRVPDPEDPWASADASERAAGLLWDAWFKAGHGRCGGWSESLLGGHIACTCGGVIPVPERPEAA